MSRILLLTSNPKQDLQLNREISDLTSVIQRLSSFELILGLDRRKDELQGLLAEHSPQIVHFCGHGAGEEGLQFIDGLISNEVLARIFKNFADDINCAVLNACDSDRQAELIVEHIDHVVGMTQPILDQAAHVFAVGFYTGIATGKSIEKAYDIGCTQVQIWSETNNQPNQSRQYRKINDNSNRKAIYDPPENESQSVNIPLAEHLKPLGKIIMVLEEG